MKNLVLILLVIVLFAFNSTFSQHEDHSTEVTSSVQELSDFHEVVYPMWHTAYPNKDYALFKELLPDVNAGVEKIYAAKLPGILRDKEKEWNKGLDKLRASVAEYNKACEENNEAGMLTSAEELHSNFEMLVRIVKPVTKEVDEFHKVLYVIYHKYLPEKNYDAIKSVCEDLKTKAEAIVNAKPNKKVESKLEQFKTAAGELAASVNELAEVCKSNDNTAIEKSVENIHTKYQKLEAVFD